NCYHAHTLRPKDENIVNDTLHDPCAEIDVQGRDVVIPCPKKAAPWILTATILGSSMAFIDGSVVNMVLPVLQRELGATVAEAQWLIESYALFLAALILVGGSLGDLYGHRRIYCFGVVGFAIASLLCGFAQSPNQLILARAVQGVAGALLVPGSLAIISANFDAGRRGAAIGTWSAATALTMAVGPVLGAWLTDTFSWRWIFFMNIPIALVVIAIVASRVPETKRAGCKPLDKTGAVLTVLGLGLLTFGLIESSRYGLDHPLIIATVTGGAIALVVFIRQQLRNRHPMVPLALFKSKTFSGANLMTFFLYAALAGAFFFIPFYLINILGYSTTQAAAAFLPFIIIMSVFSRYAGSVADKYGARLPMTIGPVVTAVGYFLFMLPGAEANYWVHLFPAIIIQGIGMTMAVAPLTTTVMNSVDEENLGIASGINNMVSRTAGLLAIAAFGIVYVASAEGMLNDIASRTGLSIESLQAYFSKGGLLSPPNFDSETSAGLAQAITSVYETVFMHAFHVVMLIVALLTLMSGIISWFTVLPKKVNA
ncbi:MAG: MFS transporter, partial [Gammaproteobacteria bacterium]|nr:MFS transporter [Gammaproteobacteria bacterium]